MPFPWLSRRLWWCRWPTGSANGGVAGNNSFKAVANAGTGNGKVDTALNAMGDIQKQITQAILGLYDEIADKRLLQRRITLGADIYTKEEAAQKTTEQLDFFTAPVEKQAQAEELEREQARLLAMLEIKKKFGKNAIFRGMNLEEGATARDRNGQIGGHKA